MEVRLVSSDEDLKKISPVMLQLRTGFDQENLIKQIKEQQQGNYHIAYVESDDIVLCVAGFVISCKLAWGKHIYVDDLVTTEHNRSSGAGKCMIDWLKQHALENGCSQIQLDSGVNRFAAHRFYLREGFNITSHHFALTDLS